MNLKINIFLINQFLYRIRPQQKKAVINITMISNQKFGVPILRQDNMCTQNLPEGPPEGPLKGKAGN